jgi:hypothetical protein
MNKHMDALEAIKQMEAVTITPEDAARVLGCGAHNLRLQAEEDPSSLGFNVIRVGSRTIIPRLPFIRFVEG